MTMEFFVAASIVLIFFCLFFAALFFGLYVSKKDRLESLKKEEPAGKGEVAAPQETAGKTGTTPQETAGKTETTGNPLKGTPLNKETIKQAIRFNGFVPYEGEDDWIFFKIQGYQYACRYRSGALVQFLTGYTIDMTVENLSYELMVKAAEKVEHETFMGKITFDGLSSMNFNVTGVELTYEHFCMSFMTYIRLLANLDERHRNEYAQLENALKNAEDSKRSHTEMQGEKKTLS